MATELIKKEQHKGSAVGWKESPLISASALFSSYYYAFQPFVSFLHFIFFTLKMEISDGSDGANVST